MVLKMPALQKLNFDDPLSTLPSPGIESELKNYASSKINSWIFSKKNYVNNTEFSTTNNIFPSESFTTFSTTSLVDFEWEKGGRHCNYSDSKKNDKSFNGIIITNPIEITNSESFEEKINQERNKKIYQMDFLIKSCRNLNRLSYGWDSYDAEPPNDQAIERASNFLYLFFLSGITPYPKKVIPTVEGGVGIVFSFGKKYLDIEFFNNDEVIIGMSDDLGKIEIKEIDNVIEKSNVMEIISEFFHS